MRHVATKLIAAIALSACVASGPVLAQTATPPAAQPAAPASSSPTPAPATPAPATPAPTAPPGAVVQPAPSTPAPSTPATPPPATTQAKPPETGDQSATLTLELKARPAVAVRGAASWDDGYKAIMAAIAKARGAALKAGLKDGGRPIAAFTDTDDNGFKFEAMIPLEAAPTGTVDFGPEAKLSQTPAGKALKFQHRGAYDDVDSTYEAITAYLDEKGYDAQNVFVEEYVNDPKGPDDTGLMLDIYVLIK